MEIHKPRAAHSLREFLIEIGTITCGILIALGLEQAIEAVHWSQTVREAKAAIHSDLALAEVFGEERRSLKPCADAYLDALSSAVVASPPQWRPLPVTDCGVAPPDKRIYVAFWRPWPTGVWRSVEAAGSVPHFDGRYGSQAPFTFSFVSELGALDGEERVLTADLAPLGYPIVLTPEARVGFLKTLAHLHAINDQMAGLSRDLEGNIRSLGEAPTEAELQAARAKVPFLFVRPGVLRNIPPRAAPRS